MGQQAAGQGGWSFRLDLAGAVHPRDPWNEVAEQRQAERFLEAGPLAEAPALPWAFHVEPDDLIQDFSPVACERVTQGLCLLPLLQVFTTAGEEGVHTALF